MKINRLLTHIFILLFLYLNINAGLNQLNQKGFLEKVSKSKVNVFVLNDKKSSVLKVINKGEKILVKSLDNKWYLIMIDGHKGYILKEDLDNFKSEVKKVKEKKKESPKDNFFIMGMGMIRSNWTKVKGDGFRFKYSDMGLPADFSTRERAAFVFDGTFGGRKYKVDGHFNYDPENRIMEPPLDFLINITRDKYYLTIGDNRNGFRRGGIFTIYNQPTRGAVLGYSGEHFGLEVLGGVARGESGFDEFLADSGSGPYYIKDSPVLRGSEVVFLVSKNRGSETQKKRLVKNKDYYIDYDRGSLVFNYAIYPYDESGNPVYVQVNYQYESLVGSFSRAVWGVNSYFRPFEFLKFGVSYIADNDKNLSFSDLFKDPRTILSFSLEVQSDFSDIYGEFSVSKEPGVEKQYAFFGGGKVNLSQKLKFYFNSWSLDKEFSSFANKQLQYGYTLFQIFPDSLEKSIFLSPFQFTRNLSAQLYPFSMSGLSVDEREYHGILEWSDNLNKFSLGYGSRKELSSENKINNIYLSSFHNAKNTKLWAKAGLEKDYRGEEDLKSDEVKDLLLGARQKLFNVYKGAIFVQGDFEIAEDEQFLSLKEDKKVHKSFSISTEYLEDDEGLFAVYRKETLEDKTNDRELVSNDIYEFGFKYHVYKGFFVDSRYRKENNEAEGQSAENSILSLGVGFESTRFRALTRYEIQLNDSDTGEGKRRLFSIFLFGSPLKNMSVNLRYYKRFGRNTSFLTIHKDSEEQLNFRFLWRPWDFLNIYSQWRFDSNMDYSPPLDELESNSLACVNGIKLRLSKRFEFLSNYKLIKVWGPIENRKYSLAAELGYLMFKHFRLGIGYEYIDFSDKNNQNNNYNSNVGYLKFIAVF